VPAIADYSAAANKDAPTGESQASREGEEGEMGGDGEGGGTDEIQRHAAGSFPGRLKSRDLSPPKINLDSH